MYFARTEEALEREMRENLFDAGLIVGANALVGRRVSGLGIANLRDRVRHGPRASQGGVEILRREIRAEDIAPDALIRQLEQLGIYPSQVSTGCCQDSVPPALSS